MKYSIMSVLLIVFFTLFGATTVYGQDIEDDSEELTPSKQVEVEFEYLTPTQEHRQIDTSSLNIWFNQRSVTQNISFFTGLTITHAEGFIESHGFYYDESVYGIGPAVLLRYTPFKQDQFSLSLDASGGLIIYSEDFPTGGDFYNFMWRIGPTVTYHFNEDTAFRISYKWMHVSNGQPNRQHNDQSSRNPAYDAEGFSISLQYLF